MGGSKDGNKLFLELTHNMAILTDCQPQFPVMSRTGRQELTGKGGLGHRGLREFFPARWAPGLSSLFCA